MSSSVSFWQRIRRTPYQAVASVFMIFMTLFVLAIFLILAGGLTSLLSYFETKPQLTVFFKDDKSKASIDELIQNLQATGKVSTFQYISKDQALAIYRDQNKNDPLLLEMVTADILPSSLEISAISPKYLVELAELTKKDSSIDEVVFQKDVVDTLVSWTSMIRKIGAIFLIFLAFSTIFILLTSVGMKIALKKEEIEILRLVGATSWYIRRPFIYEGIVYGLTGATLAWLIVSGFLLYLNPFITSFLKGIPSLSLLQINTLNIYIWPPTIVIFSILLAVLLLAGFLIGLIGSSLAVSRYLKN